MRRPCVLLVAITCLVICGLCADQKAFTVKDEIGLVTFPTQDAVLYSPNREWVVVRASRGRLDIDKVELILRIYRVRDLLRPSNNKEAKPYWVVTSARYKYGYGPYDEGLLTPRWLKNSTGIAFVEKTGTGNNQLMLADLQTKTLRALSAPNQSVTAFDVRNRSSFVYAVLSPKIREEAVSSRHQPMLIGTGKNLFEILYPEESSQNIFYHDLQEVWAARQGHSFRVSDPRTGKWLALHLEGAETLSLSPDGRWIAAALMVQDVPSSWETFHPREGQRQLKAGHQEVYQLFAGSGAVSEFVAINLEHDALKHLTEAPTASSAGWYLGSVRSDWSANGESVLLSGSYLAAKQPANSSSVPCVAVVIDLTGARTKSCIDSLDGSGINPQRAPRIMNQRFVEGNSTRVEFTFYPQDSDTTSKAILKLQADGTWKKSAPESAESVPQVRLSEGMNTPPRIYVSSGASNREKLVWDPNPQLQNVKLGNVEEITWSDSKGRRWKGGLYKPPDYVEGKKYPVVVQPHYFWKERFFPNGTPYPTVYVGQELATNGFVVFELGHFCVDSRLNSTPDEMPCVLDGLESGLEQLVKAGVADPERLGIMGFSRPCWEVLAALTSKKFNFKAALIADGFVMSYMQYLLSSDLDPTNITAKQFDALVGQKPFGKGFDAWRERSPTFNMEKVTTPLAVVATRGLNFLSEWEPYATLRYLNKPVDIIRLDSTEHVFTDPKLRFLSQGYSLDWFRFWLQGYEDTDQNKAEQYKRWNVLRQQMHAFKIAGDN